MKYQPMRWYADEPFRPFFDDWRSDGFMAADVKKKDDGYIVQIQVPGVSKENLSIELDGEWLTVAATQEESDNSEYVHRESKRFGTRKFRVPGIDGKEIEAKLSDGILTIAYEAGDQENKKKIEIQ